MKTEFTRRLSLRDKLEAYLKDRPGQWLSMRELSAVGGIGGWRTRLSELTRRAGDPLVIEWNGKNGEASAHRYLPYQPLGRDAAERIEPMPTEPGRLF